MGKRKRVAAVLEPAAQVYVYAYIIYPCAYIYAYTYICIHILYYYTIYAYAYYTTIL